MGDPRDWRVLRPMSLADLLQISLRVYRGRARTMIALSVLLQAPVLLLNGAAGSLLLSYLPPDLLAGRLPLGRMPELPPEATPVLLGVLGSAILVMVATTLTRAAIIFATGRTLLGDEPGALESFAAVVSRLRPIVAGSLIGIAATVGLFLAGAIVVGILAVAGGDPRQGGVTVFLAIAAAIVLVAALVALSIRWSLFGQAAMLEDRSGAAALGRSWRLVAGSMWRLFGLFLLVGITVQLLAVTVVSLAGALWDPIAGLPLALVLGTVFGTLVQVLLAPFEPIFATLVYFDLRVRREGFDLPRPGAAEAPPEAPAAAG